MNHSQISFSMEPLWGQVFKSLEEEIPKQFFDAFFSKIQPISWDGKQLILGSNDKRVLQHLKNKYINDVKNHVAQITGQEAEVSFQDLFSENNSTDFQNTKLNSSNHDSNTDSPPSINKANYPNKILLNPKYSFDRFIKGPSNEHALAAAMAVSQEPSQYHNPLYLYGGVGLGKTHLMMAIGNEIEKTSPWLKVLYVPAETFQNDLVESVSKKTLGDLRTRYRQADILMVDDIQFISQRAEFTQEEIFHTFNYLYQNNKHIIISGDRPPQQLSTLTDRLVSRFSSGLIVDIKPPNLETRMAILSSKAKEAGLVIPAEVIRFIAGRFNSHIRLLESAIIKLEFISQQENRAIDLQMAKIALRDIASQEVAQDISIDEIIRIVSHNFHVNEEEIKGSSRTEQVTLGRHVCMYLAKILIPSLSLSRVAAAFGRNDHTTVIHATKKIEQKMDEDEVFAVQIKEIIEDLKI